MPSYEWANEIKLGRKKIVVGSNIPRSQWPLRGEEIYDLWAVIAAAIPADLFVISWTIINPNTPTAKLRLTLSNASTVNIDVSTLEDTMTNAQILATFSAWAPVTLNSTASIISFLWADGLTHTLQLPASVTTTISQAITSGGRITASTGWTADISFYQSTTPTATFTGQKWTDTSTTPSIQKVWDGTSWVVDDATRNIQAQNWIWFNSVTWKLEEWIETWVSNTQGKYIRTTNNNLNWFTYTLAWSAWKCRFNSDWTIEEENNVGDTSCRIYPNDINFKRLNSYSYISQVNGWWLWFKSLSTNDVRMSLDSTWDFYIHNTAVSWQNTPNTTLWNNARFYVKWWASVFDNAWVDWNEICEFRTDRSWSVYQRGVGAATKTQLMSNNDWRTFSIADQTNEDIVSFISNGVANTSSFNVNKAFCMKWPSVAWVAWWTNYTIDDIWTYFQADCLSVV